MSPQRTLVRLCFFLGSRIIPCDPSSKHRDHTCVWVCGGLVKDRNQIYSDKMTHTPPVLIQNGARFV